MGEADRSYQSDCRGPGALDGVLSGGVRAISAARDEDTAMFRFKDTYVFLQRGAAHQDGASGDVLSLAQKGVGQFVIFVDDVDAVHAELDHAQVATISGPADRDWGMRTLTLADPGGYTWEITQELPSGPSSS